MAQSKPSASASAAERQSRIDNSAYVSGMAEAFAGAMTLGPQVLALQRALLAGVVSGGQREMARLKALGESEPRVAAAAQRVARFAALTSELDSHATIARQVAQTFQRNGLFQGHVVQADGTPAPDHAVRIELAAAATQKRPVRKEARTDTTGFFSIDLSGAGALPGAKAAEGPLDGLLHRDTHSTAAAAPSPAAAAPSAPSAAAPAAPAAAEGAGAGPAAVANPPAAASRVEVLDASGRVVFEDPSPPTFDGLGSEFRYYVLPTTSTASTPRKATRKP